jgi:hypothetical protein
LIVIVWAEALSQSTTLDLEAAQLERGATATPFEVRPVGTELALCQRYCYVLAPGIDKSVISTQTRRSGGLFLSSFVPVPDFRVTPSFSHNVTAWSDNNLGPVNTNMGAEGWVVTGRISITSSGTLDAITGNVAGRYALVQPRATTSFSGTDGDVGDLRIGKDVLLTWDAEL